MLAKARNQIRITTKTLVDEATGERVDVQEVYKEVKIGQKQFWRLYLADFLHVLGMLENKPLDVLIYILEHTPPATNMFLGTYRKIAKDCGVSVSTVERTIDKLSAANFLIKVQNGAYQVSPEIMFKGNENKKAMLIKYRNDVMDDSHDPDAPGSAGDDDDNAPGSAGDDDDNAPGSAGG